MDTSYETQSARRTQAHVQGRRAFLRSTEATAAQRGEPAGKHQAVLATPGMLANIGDRQAPKDATASIHGRPWTLTIVMLILRRRRRLGRREEPRHFEFGCPLWLVARDGRPCPRWSARQARRCRGPDPRRSVVATAARVGTASHSNAIRAYLSLSCGRSAAGPTSTVQVHWPGSGHRNWSRLSSESVCRAPSPDSAITSNAARRPVVG